MQIERLHFEALTSDIYFAAVWIYPKIIPNTSLSSKIPVTNVPLSRVCSEYKIHVWLVWEGAVKEEKLQLEYGVLMQFTRYTSLGKSKQLVHAET